MIGEQEPVTIARGNNLATKFDYDFYIESEEQLVVEHTNLAGVTSVLTHGVDYSIEGIGEENGGYINFPLEDSTYGVLAWDKINDIKEMLVIYLDLPFEQAAEFDLSGDLNKDNLEQALDYQMRCTQILDRKLRRAVLVKEGDTATPEELISSIENAKFDAQDSAQIAAEKANIAIEYADKANDKANVATEQADLAAATANKALEDISGLMSELDTKVQNEINPVLEQIEPVTIVANNIDTVTEISENLDNFLNKAVSVGKTTTGEAGTNANVVNAGTKLNPILDFTIPKGEKGDDGGMTAEYIEETKTLDLYSESGTALNPKWGNITGNINSQTDLLNALDNKANKSEITNFATQTQVMQAIASIPRFKISIVKALPETGGKMILYLVSKGGESPDVYDEYLWIEETSSYEFLGTTAVDLTDYVKNTDYATGTKGGVFVTSDTYNALVSASTGYLYTATKTLDQYGRMPTSAFIGKGTVENIKNDLVKRAVTENDIELTDEEKTSARTWLGAVGNTDYASTTKAGLIAMSSNYATGAQPTTGAMYCNTIALSNYGTAAKGAFISKGTLDNVLTQYAKIVSITQADYDALETKDANTLYLIEEE